MSIKDFDKQMAELNNAIAVLERLIEKLEQEKEALLMASIPF